MIEDILKQLYHVQYSGRIANLDAMASALKVSGGKLLKVVEKCPEKN